MGDHTPNEPTPADFKETAERSQEAEIADESAAYDNATQPTEGGPASEESEAHPS